MMKNKANYFYLFIRVFPSALLLFVLSSCLSNKRMVYLNDKDFEKVSEKIIPAKGNVYTIRPDDVLSVKVQGADPRISAFFNLETQGINIGANPASLYITGYTVNDSGYVSLPVIGRQKVEGLNIHQAQSLIEMALAPHLSNATVVLKLVSFKVSVLGEVNHPGYYYVYNNQATLLEGLSMAGDLNQFGDRKKVKLIRPVADGLKTVMLDLTDPSLMSSEYFYLMPNDMLYVEPVRAKAVRSNFSAATAVFAGVSTLILILNYIAR